MEETLHNNIVEIDLCFVDKLSVESFSVTCYSFSKFCTVRSIAVSYFHSPDDVLHGHGSGVGRSVSPHIDFQIPCESTLCSA